MPRWAAMVDGNLGVFVEALEKFGWTVISLARLGGGVPDLLIAKQGRTALVEVKIAHRDASKSLSAVFPDGLAGEWAILTSLSMMSNGSTTASTRHGRPG